MENCRRRLGLEKTGCLGFLWLTSCLLFCVASVKLLKQYVVIFVATWLILQVWAPGSPFDPTNSYVTAVAGSETDGLASQREKNGTTAEAHVLLEPEEEGSKIAVSLLLVGIISFRWEATIKQWFKSALFLNNGLPGLVFGWLT